MARFARLVRDGRALAAGAAMALAAGFAHAATLISIDSTSAPKTAIGYAPVNVQPFVNDGQHLVLTANDLGMHCADLDARVVTILPPFNVLHAQVVKLGALPALLTSTSVSVAYSATYNPADPALAVAPVTAADGSIFKSNAGPLFVATYSPIYPVGVLAPFFPNAATTSGDLGLPVPDLQKLYLGSGALSFVQATMPSVTVAQVDPKTGAPTVFQSKPYVANSARPFRLFDVNWPLFVKFPFGYAARKVNWFAAEGIPMAPFDDQGRENPFSLMRVSARDRATGKIVATTDTVVPVSGETSCKTCHLPASYPGANGYGVRRLASPTVPASDPKFGHVIAWVSEEWASDINILRVHDRKHGTTLFAGCNRVTGASPKPVLCQTCHYSPALDLAQGGPLPSQAAHESMSRVMHYSHGLLAVNGVRLFTLMPPPNDPRRVAPAGSPPVTAFTQQALQGSCYQCHPGTRTKCLRGTMYAKAGAVCQDCHGQMTQVGNDFSRAKPAGAFILASDYYTNPATPRVPWANEPGCGSCHTGDANASLAGRPNTIAARDGLRLLRAYLSNDPKATPIVPANRRFAEPLVTSGPAKGNPQLYRLSTGHGGVMCEGCHGSTHAEWPLADPHANDNVTATELQGHTGKLLECGACHTGAMAASLNGPHGLHPVGAGGLSTSWVSTHGDYADSHGLAACAACHGKSGQGSPLAIAAVARSNLPCEGGALCPGAETTITLAANTTVSCNLCHGNPFTGGLAAARPRAGLRRLR